jgi:hypothetical protein
MPGGMGELGSNTMDAAQYAKSTAEPKGNRFIGNVITRRFDGHAYVADSIAHESWKQNNDELSEKIQAIE